MDPMVSDMLGQVGGEEDDCEEDTELEVNTNGVIDGHRSQSQPLVQSNDTFVVPVSGGGGDRSLATSREKHSISATSMDMDVTGIDCSIISVDQNNNNNSNDNGTRDVEINEDDDNDDIAGGGGDGEIIDEVRDDRGGCRSLVCSANGIIVAEMIYRCMICANMADSMAEAHKHYQLKHIDGSKMLDKNSSNDNTCSSYNFNLPSSTNASITINNNSNYNSNNNNNSNTAASSRLLHHTSSNFNSYSSNLTTIQSLLSNPGNISTAMSTITSKNVKDSIKNVASNCSTLIQHRNANGNIGNNSSDVEEEDFSFSSQEMPLLTTNYDTPLNYAFDDFDSSFFNSTSFIPPTLSTKKARAPAESSVINSSTPTNLVTSGSSSRGGYVTCEVCHLTKFYASVQRRYGQFTCMGCAKFFGRFLMKPRRYYCPNLGSCPLNQTPRCKACLLQACINTYVIDEKRMKIVNANRPLRRMGPGSTTSDQPPIATEECDKDTGAVVHSQKSVPEATIGRGAAHKPSGQAGNKTKSTSKVDKLINSTVIKDKSSSHRGKNLRPSKRTAPSPVEVISNNNNNSNSNTNNDRADSDKSNEPCSKNANGTNPGRKVAGCRACQGCLAEDCGSCHYCLDKPKFGGGNTLKKKCVTKKCLAASYRVKASHNIRK
ncbi:uncharacterized protein LOC141856395 isoform X2 [Brevipalpus obovatus]|uniref:uncharacterized protein LOC141856395 isoform X2 n=1 Tax=Brevipalpus obovatus TaxID=246614 RepID=UPI003D9EF07B